MYEFAKEGGAVAALFVALLTVGLGGAVGWWLRMIITPQGIPSSPTELARSWAGWMVFGVCLTLLSRFFGKLDANSFAVWLAGGGVWVAIAYALGWTYGKFVKFKSQQGLAITEQNHAGTMQLVVRPTRIPSAGSGIDAPIRRMLFSATQADGLRIAIVDSKKLTELDIESVKEDQCKGNIYKAVITRVEPSLKAAFLNYGAERDGSLSFKDIAPLCLKGCVTSKVDIQDELKVGQQLIVQIVKEQSTVAEAALTTYVSLVGRYLVLMPYTPRGDGRHCDEESLELREIMSQLNVPATMNLIARPTSIGRTLKDLHQNLTCLLNLWAAIERAATMQTGPFLIYQESSQIIRAISDYFDPEIDEILIDSDEIYEQVRQYILHVTPGMANRVKRYHEEIPLLARFRVARATTQDENNTAALDENAIYAAIGIELETGATDKGLWFRLYAECEGDENKTKAAYIKQRAVSVISAQRTDLERAAQETQIEESQRRHDEKILQLRNSSIAKAFRYAVARGHPDDVRELLAREPDLANLRDDEYGGRTMLMIAGQKRFGEIVQLLLDGGADINATTRQGQTAKEVLQENGCWRG